MKKSIWTMVLIGLLALFGIFSGIALLGYLPSVDPSAEAVGILLLVTLAVVAWMETRWGALLVVAIGLLSFVANIITVALNLYPQYGTQTEQYLYSLLLLLIPLFGALSYRSIAKQG